MLAEAGVVEGTDLTMSLGSKLLLALLILIVVFFAVATPFGARRSQEKPPPPKSVSRDSSPTLASIENRFGQKTSDVDTLRLSTSDACRRTGDKLNYMPGRTCIFAIRPDSETSIAYLVLQLAAGAGRVGYKGNGDTITADPQSLKADSLLRIPVRKSGGVLTVECPPPVGCVIKIPR